MIYLVIFLVLLAIIFFLFLNTGPKLAAHTDALIQEVQKEPLLDLVKGKTGMTKTGPVSIHYELISKGKENKGTILLVCGHTQTSLEWPTYLYEPLLAAGYQVVRYDNRGVGLSDWMANWTKKRAYQLEDMAKDGLAVLDTLGISKAHVIGVSMGGMIGQIMAINHSERVLSLTSIMSTGFYFDKELGDVPRQFMMDITRVSLRHGRGVKTEEGKLKLHLAIRQLLKGQGDYPFDDKSVLKRALVEVRTRKGYNMKATDQHSLAIKKSGSRYEGLKKLQVPTLVIHGTSDPLIPFKHAKKYSAMIPNVRTLFIEGMGHDLPAVHAPVIVKELLAFFADHNA